MKRSKKKSKRRRKYQQNPSAMYSKSRMKSIIPLSRVRGHVRGENKQKGLELFGMCSCLREEIRKRKRKKSEPEDQTRGLAWSTTQKT
ncbi:hypothetical protein F2Q70_00009172 [Brassica cretica]|uniref:Uncharacterized protein n=1 Tax=Brassica cretica TaxID=69181 RepID=A0A8S9LST1_BRACR|nr:hypothetical protein F2Q70_00009172 [Brassica cretica]